MLQGRKRPRYEIFSIHWIFTGIYWYFTYLLTFIYIHVHFTFSIFGLSDLQTILLYFFSLFSLPSLAFAFFLSWLPLLCNPLAWGAERRGFLPNNGHHRKLGPIVPSGSRLPLLPLYLPFLYSYCTTHHHQTNIAHPSLPGESKLTTQRPALDHGWTFFFFFLFQFDEEIIIQSFYSIFVG